MDLLLILALTLLHGVTTLALLETVLHVIANGKPIPESAIRNIDLWTA